MYNMSDYRAALSERGNYDMDSADWKLAQQKVQSIVAVLVAAGDKAMVGEVVEEVYSLNDCGCSLEDLAIQYDLCLLESNGYIKEAQELRELDWE